ncbi:hypothetical protein EAE96_003590 [Botrytis aclada]|nr:hypothetical protein EAE96_003590 [Botrytis aclada]
MGSPTAIVVYNNTEEVGVHQELQDTSQQGEHTPSEILIPHASEENKPTSSSLGRSLGSSLGFLELSIELREMIYKEYFSITEPISFKTGKSSSLALHLDKNYGIHTGLLLANRQVHSEAAPYLYSKTVFNFVAIPPTHLLPTTDAAFAYFLRQIGVSNTKLLRHLVIDLPNFWPFPLHCNRPEDVPRPVEDSVRMFKQIVDQCTKLVTLRIEFHQLHDLFSAFTYSEAIPYDTIATDWIDEQLKGMPFLKDVVVHLQVIDQKGKEYRGWKNKSREYGWIFEVTDHERTGNKDEALDLIMDAIYDWANLETPREKMQQGYYIKRQTSDGGFEIDYELSYRAACRKIEEGLLKSA